jgi:hypothetical protein
MRFFSGPAAVIFFRFLIPGILCSGCAFYVRTVEPPRYMIKILYSSEQLTGDSLSDQSLLILPALTRDGPDTTRFLSPLELSRLLGDIRGDLNFVFPMDFEKKLRSTGAGGDGNTLKRFYASLYEGKTLEIQTADSVWRSVDAAYLLVFRVKYAVKVIGFDGNISRRLTMETELWNVGAAEAAWRAEVVGIDRQTGTTDSQFVRGAFKEVLKAFPGYIPANNEKDW